MKRPNGLFLLDTAAFDTVYRPGAARRIGECVDLLGPPLTRSALDAHADLLAKAELIFTGWGMARADEAFLARCPNLRAIFYGAGAISSWCTPAVWARGIAVTTANDANAIPVAEFTVAATIFSLKLGWQLTGTKGRRRPGFGPSDVPGNYGSTLGLVGMGTIARLVVERVRPFGLRVIAHDPYLPAAEAERLGVTMVGLDELFAESDVVSLHAPDLPTTRGLIGAQQLSRLRPFTTFINTSRGRVVREDELAEVMRARPDLHAVLDVTEVEPLPESSPLASLTNVTLTPHIAGSTGRECARMGDWMADELDRYLAGEPMRYQIQPAALAHSVHAPSMPTRS